MMTGHGTHIIRTDPYVIMLLCCYVIMLLCCYVVMLLCYYIIPGLGHAIRMSVEQPISVMVSHTVPISSHAGLVGVTSCPPVVAIYPYVNMAAPASIIYMYSRTLPACFLI